MISTLLYYIIRKKMSTYLHIYILKSNLKPPQCYQH
nr:MAG TPA: hypothetical protein [Caudoviricetes sp.]